MTHTCSTETYIMHTRCPVHASMYSAPLRKKGDALRSSARSGYLMRRLRHAVSRPCDAICAVLEPSAVLRVVRCGRCCSHIRFCDELIADALSPLPRDCSASLRARQAAQMPSGATPLLLCFSQRPPSTGLGVAGFAIRSHRGRHRPRASPRSPNGPIRARVRSRQTARQRRAQKGWLGARFSVGSVLSGRAKTATFLTRPSNDKFQAGRHHPYMGEFERVHRFLFDRRMPFLLLVVSHRAPRSR